MNIQSLTQSLELFLSADQNKIAEKRLSQMQKMQGYGPLLFAILTDSYSPAIKVAAAIAFKNFIKQNWKVDESNDDRVAQNDRDIIKNQIVELMLGSDIQIQKQLSEAVSIIGRSDFPNNWPSLLPHLVHKIEQGNFTVINGVLQTCNSLFKRYEYETRSDELFLEIKKVISEMGPTLTQLISQTMVLIQQHANDKAALTVLWNSVLLICKIFFSINHQDLPEYFEDNITHWMGEFHKIFGYSNGLLIESNTETPGILEETKAQVIDILCLYQSKYNEEFTPFLTTFISDVLNVVLGSDSKPKFDTLVSVSLDFLSLVAQRMQHREIFISTVNLQQLCQDIIIPSIEFRQSDEDMFSEDAEEYIRLDIEGSNAQSRRKSACELVKSLCRHFESEIVQNFSIYIQQLLTSYQSDPAANAKCKDSALFLITSVASKGGTERLGVTSTTEFVDLKSFYGGHVMPELNNSIGTNPVIKADCIKYLMAFRNILNPDDIRNAINLLPAFIVHPSTVVHSYAAAAINKLLMVKDPNTNVGIISAENIARPDAVLGAICNAFKMEGSEENEYLMQALMRCLCVLQSNAMGHMNDLVNFLKEKLICAVKNPKKPKFNHFLIESVALCIKIVCTTNPSFVSSFESIIFPIFDKVLCENVEEFVPYAFQLFSLMLDQHPAQNVSDNYVQLFPFLVNLELWESNGNIPALIRLLLSYLEKASGGIIADKLPALISIFEKLNMSRALDSFGFSLMTAVLLYLPQDQTLMHLKMVFISCFQRMSKPANKTMKYLKGFVQFFCSVVLIFPPSTVLQLITGIQTNLFDMVLTSAVLPTICNVTDNASRKVCIMGLVQLLTECPELIVGNQAGYWKPLFTKAVECLLAYNPAVNPEAEARFIDVDDSLNNATVLNQMIFVARKVIDPAKDVEDPRGAFGMKMQQLATRDRQRFSVLYGSVDAPVRESLQQLLASLGISLQ